MNGLTDLTGNRTSLAEIAGEDTVESVQKLDNGVIKVFKIIRDYENKPIAKVQITVDSPCSERAFKNFHILFYTLRCIFHHTYNYTSSFSYTAGLQDRLMPYQKVLSLKMLRSFSL
jgi:hypothetical protein